MDYDIVICGAGHTGNCLKAMLASCKGLKVLLIAPEQKPAYAANSPHRLFAISKGSLQILSKFIDYAELKKIGQPIKQIKVLEDKSPFHLDFSPEEIEAENFGLMIQEDHLHALFESSGSDIKTKIGTVKTFEQDAYKVSISLEDGAIITSALFLAADGKHSAIRKKLGAQMFKHDYRQCGLVCEVEHQHNHQGVAVEKFMASGPFAILPRIGGYSSSIVWSVKSDWRQAFISLPEEVQHPLITEHFPEDYGKVTVTSAIQLFPLNLQLAKTPVHGRIVLVGDAAHAMHPLAGQGFNLTIRDLDLLIYMIKENHRLGLDIGCQIMLDRYRKQRKLDINILLESTHYLNAVFSNGSKLIRLARGLGISLLDKISFLKKRCMLYALGGLDL